MLVTAIDIEGAEKAFKALTLSDFPGENVSDLARVALKHIKIMSGAYALPAIEALCYAFLTTLLAPF